ncbi:Rho-binding antiterminator [Cellvibrio mixtus]|uniref:Rho-binding antiterminator n=1 Tax=Cellvibrio mixtus TaxID=39650 RepID=UPI00058798FA|nr:Rho-binding antiterminator [Cellvibrio mixtus]
MISCDQHDYIEIVCTYRYPLKLTLKSGEIIQGIALDTQQNDNRDECIKIESKGSSQLIVLDQIKKLEVTEDNPHLREVVFSQQ